MSSSEHVEEIFDDVDTNRDGRIDKREMRNWLSKDEGTTSATYETSTYRRYPDENTGGRRDRYTHTATTAITSGLTSDSVITTHSSEETRRYLEKSSATIFIDSHPQVIRRQTTERPITFEQRVFIRCLQPPPLPPPEPLIIKEVRAEQLPPPPPLIIREYRTDGNTPPPLTLRERPPTPPPRIAGETVIRTLPPAPAPLRSVVVERYPPGPDKPRDIIIERWCPYGPQPERQKIVQPAPPLAKYTAPTHTVIEYGDLQTKVVRKFERLGVTEEDPKAYMARYGSSLLDSGTLVQQARNAGVTEDISCPLLAASVSVSTRGKTLDYERTIDEINRGISSSGGYHYERFINATSGDNITRGHSSYSTSGLRTTGDNILTGGGFEVQSECHTDDDGLISGCMKRNEESNQKEFRRYF